MSEKLPVTLTVITKNEAHNLERCLRSVPWAAEILVLDSQSNDGTVEIAQRLGARVLQETWRGFGPQKQRAAELAQHEWILNLDADEALSPELSQELQSLWQNGLQNADAYEMPRLSFHLGRWIRHGGWHPDWQRRFFNRRKARWTDSAVHERVEAAQGSLRTARLQAPLQHYPFGSIARQVETNNRYSSLGAQELQRRGVRYSCFKLLTKPCSKFVECYLFKRGFLDGWAGFVIAVGAAYSVFLKWAKLRELQKVPVSLR